MALYKSRDERPFYYGNVMVAWAISKKGGRILKSEFLEPP